MSEEKRTAITPIPTRRDDRLRKAPTATGPFGLVHRFADEMDRIFEDFGLGPRWSTATRAVTHGAEVWAPQIDMFQRGNELVVKADLPGMTKDEVKVDVTDDAITITGERRREHEEEREGIYRIERSSGSFRRVVALPEGAITDQAKATFRNGVLEISMPAPPEQVTRGRRLEINQEAKK
jgi:HSP20 family protein